MAALVRERFTDTDHLKVNYILTRNIFKIILVFCGLFFVPRNICLIILLSLQVSS